MHTFTHTHIHIYTYAHALTHLHTCVHTYTHTGKEKNTEGRRKEEREMQPESTVPGSLVLVIGVTAQTQPRLFLSPCPGHAHVCLRRQEPGGSL